MNMNQMSSLNNNNIMNFMNPINIPSNFNPMNQMGLPNNFNMMSQMGLSNTFNMMNQMGLSNNFNPMNQTGLSNTFNMMNQMGLSNNFNPMNQMGFPYNMNNEINSSIITINLGGLLKVLDQYIFVLQDFISSFLKGENNSLEQSFFSDLLSDVGGCEHKLRSMNNIKEMICNLNTDLANQILEDIKKKMFVFNGVIMSVGGVSFKCSFVNDSNDLCSFFIELNKYIISLQDFITKYIIKNNSLEQSTFLKFKQYIYQFPLYMSQMNDIKVIINNTINNNNQDICNNLLPPWMPGQMQMMMQTNPMNSQNINDGFQFANNSLNGIKWHINQFLQSIKKTFVQFRNDNIEGYDYVEVNEIQKENDKIINKIEKQAYALADIKENVELTRAGNFLYSVGGIARKALKLSNKIYHELFDAYKKYLNDQKKKLSHIQNNDRKNLSCWFKNQLKNNNNYINHYLENNNPDINKYLNNGEEQNLLKELFRDFISLFLKCALSFPLVEVEFYERRNEIINVEIMSDLFNKGKKYPINFCYLPKLKSNGADILGSKFYVFTYNSADKAFKKEDEKFDYEPVKQDTNLNY